jgi:hypothetical protein
MTSWRCGVDVQAAGVDPETFSLVPPCTTAVFVEAGTRAARNIDTALPVDGRKKGVLILTSVKSLR